MLDLVPIAALSKDLGPNTSWACVTMLHCPPKSDTSKVRYVVQSDILMPLWEHTVFPDLTLFELDHTRIVMPIA